MKIGQIYRIIGIQRVLIRHGFDELILSIPYLTPIKLVRYLLPWNWLGRTYKPRGERIRLVLEELGPIFVKFGQILSTRRDLIPDDIAIELRNLQDNVAAFPGEEAARIVEVAHDKKLGDLFLDFDREPLASASIAQVHAAQLLDGKQVIVKIVRPNLLKTIRQDISLMRAIATIGERYWGLGKQLKLSLIVSEFEKTILDELDMMREAANASQLRRNHENSDILYVPQIYWPLTRHDVLVMERVDGLNISNRDKLLSAGVDLKTLAEQGIDLFFSQVFRDNFFHADVHPGNMFVIADEGNSKSKVALVDFGIMGSLSDFDQRYLAENFSAFLAKDYRRVAQLHVESGWVPSSTRVEEFEFAIRAVCEPIFDRPLKDVSVGDLLLRLFQTAQRFDMEILPQLLLLQKTLVNIEGIGRELYPELDLWNAAKPSLENFMRDRVGLKSIINSLEENSQRWVTQLPEVPTAIFDLLEQTRAGRLQINTYDSSLKTIKNEIRLLRKKLTFTVVGACLVLAAMILHSFGVGLEKISGSVSLFNIFVGGCGVLVLTIATFGRR
jgi:ubiquinone biosynthesis protein